jgi:hypothetical protein
MMNTIGKKWQRSINWRMIPKILLLFWISSFFGIDLSMKLNHNWSKLRDIYKSLLKFYGEVHENHKKNGNHDDFINFCNNRSEVYYFYLWLKVKPNLFSLCVTGLPENVFADSGIHRPSPTPSNNSFGCSSKASLVDSVNALVEERKNSRKNDEWEAKLNEERLKKRISKNYDVKRLIDVKKHLQSENDRDIICVLRNYEKKLAEALDISSSSSDEDKTQLN